MIKKKCPACGSINTVKILYGEATYEPFESVERGEIMLGRCCNSEDSPTRHCEDCKQDFGGCDLFTLLEMNSFEFFTGGYFAISHFIYIDGKQKDKVIRYAKTPGGMYIDLKNSDNEINFHPDIILKEISLTLEEWHTFIRELTSLKVSCWKDKYYDNDILDGKQ